MKGKLVLGATGILATLSVIAFLSRRTSVTDGKGSHGSERKWTRQAEETTEATIEPITVTKEA